MVARHEEKYPEIIGARKAHHSLTGTVDLFQDAIEEIKSIDLNRKLVVAQFLLFKNPFLPSHLRSFCVFAHF